MFLIGSSILEREVYMMLLPFKAQDFKEHRQTTLQPFYTRVCVCVCVCVCVENGELQCEVGVMLAI